MFAGPHTWPKMSPRSVFCIVLCEGWWGGVVMVSGWHPVAWGRGCLLIGNSDNPLPEVEEGFLEEGRQTSLDHPSPRGLVGFSRTFPDMNGKREKRRAVQEHIASSQFTVMWASSPHVHRGYLWTCAPERS